METTGSWHTFEEPDAETEKVGRAMIGALIEVHRHLGPGHKEMAYLEAACHEFELRGVPYRREVCIPLLYKGKQVATGKIDLIVGELVIAELKAVSEIADVHVAQAISYLRLTGLRLAYLVNFNVTVLREGIRRVVLS